MFDVRGPFHSNSGLPVTPLGRVIEQVRFTSLPAMIGDDGEEFSEMLPDSVKFKKHNEDIITDNIHT